MKIITDFLEKIGLSKKENSCDHKNMNECCGENHKEVKENTDEEKNDWNEGR